MKSAEKVLGKAVNFGTGVEVPILELSSIILELCGNHSTPVNVAPRAGEVTRLCADISLAEKALGFKPQYTIKKGLQEFVKWYREGRYEEWTAYTSDEVT